MLLHKRSAARLNGIKVLLIRVLVISFSVTMTGCGLLSGTTSPEATQQAQSPQGTDANGNNQSSPSLNNPVEHPLLPEGALARMGNGTVADLSFSPDASSFAIVTTIGIYLYDVESFELVWASPSHNTLTSLSWSPDGSKIATGARGDLTASVILWDARTGKEITTLDASEETIALAWSPDGTKLATAGWYGTLVVRDPVTGDPLLQPLQTSSGSQVEQIEAMAWSPNSNQFATATREIVTVWDGHSGAALQVLPADDGVFSVTWSPDGTRLAAAVIDGSIVEWDARTGAKVQTIRTAMSNASVAWSPDGSILAAATWHGSVVLWDSASGELIETLTGHSGWVESLSWSSDGKYLASGTSNREVIIWDSKTGSSLTVFNGFSSAIADLDWTLDGTALASAGTYGDTIRVWNPTTHITIWEQHSDLSAGTGRALAVAWSPDGKTLAMGSDNRKVTLWDGLTGQLHNTLEGHENLITSVAWSADGTKLASGSWEDVVIVWDLASGTPAFTLHGHGGNAVANVAWSPTGDILASSGGGSVVLWDGTTGEELLRLGTEEAKISRFDWSLDGKRLIIVSGYQLSIVDVETGDFVQAITWNNSATILTIAWSPGGEEIAVATTYSIVLVDLSTGEELEVFQGHTDSVQDLVWSPDGSILASGSYDGTVILWSRDGSDSDQEDSNGGNTADSEERLTVKDQGTIDDLSVSPDGQEFAVATERGITVYQTDSLDLIWNSATDSPALTVAWSTDGKRIASGHEDHLVRLWNAATGDLLREFDGHTHKVPALAWSPNGEYLASGSWDGSVILWDSMTGEQTQRLKKYDSSIEGVAWSPDSKRIAYTSWNGTLLIWSIESGDLLHMLLCSAQPVWTAAWSPDGTLIACAEDESDSIIIWNSYSGDQIKILEAEQSAINEIVWSPNATQMASVSWSGEDNTLLILDVETGSRLYQSEKFPTGLSALAWTPDGTRLIFGTRDGTLSVLTVSW